VKEGFGRTTGAWCDQKVDPLGPQTGHIVRIIHRKRRSLARIYGDFRSATRLSHSRPARLRHINRDMNLEADSRVVDGPGATLLVRTAEN
jgi:hypothetical protein